MALLLLGPEMCEHVGQYVMGADGPADTHESLAEFFEDAGEGGVVQPQAAVLFGHGYSEKAQVLHLVDEVVGDNVFPVKPIGDGLDVPANKVADHVDDLGAGLFRSGCSHETLLVH